MPLNVDPKMWSRMAHGDQTSWIDFAGAHALQHGIFDTAIRRAGGKSYPVLPLGTTARAVWLLGEPETPPEFPWYPSDDWMAAHQQRHDGSARSLLIAASPDFQSYDLTNPEEFSTWVYLHAQEHVRLRQAIGI